LDLSEINIYDFFILENEIYEMKELLSIKLKFGLKDKIEN
jgi:hypothetical protein